MSATSYQPRTLYCVVSSEAAAKEYICVKRLDGWHILVSPFLISSHRTMVFSETANIYGMPVPISTTQTDEWAFILHHFFRSEP
jgi:hypothetical protein